LVNPVVRARSAGSAAVWAARAGDVCGFVVTAGGAVTAGWREIAAGAA
jgi:hypothetical protein